MIFSNILNDNDIDKFVKSHGWIINEDTYTMIIHDKNIEVDKTEFREAIFSGLKEKIRQEEDERMEHLKGFLSGHHEQ